MEEYDWPGNVRELEHMVVYGMSVVDNNSNMLKFEDIEDKYSEITKLCECDERQEESVCSSLKNAVEEYEKAIIEKTLKITEGNISEAAQILDVPRQTLQRKVKQRGIAAANFK